MDGVNLLETLLLGIQIPIILILVLKTIQFFLHQTLNFHFTSMFLKRVMGGNYTKLMDINQAYSLSINPDVLVISDDLGLMCDINLTKYLGPISMTFSFGINCRLDVFYTLINFIPSKL